jgi:hypothetical protein
MSEIKDLNAVAHKVIGGGPPPTEFEREQFYYSFFRPFAGREKYGCWCGATFDSLDERKSHEASRTCWFASTGRLDG